MSKEPKGGWSEVERGGGLKPTSFSTSVLTGLAPNLLRALYLGTACRRSRSDKAPRCTHGIRFSSAPGSGVHSFSATNGYWGVWLLKTGRKSQQPRHVLLSGPEAKRGRATPDKQKYLKDYPDLMGLIPGEPAYRDGNKATVYGLDARFLTDFARLLRLLYKTPPRIRIHPPKTHVDVVRIDVVVDDKYNRPRVKGITRVTFIVQPVRLETVPPVAPRFAALKVLAREATDDEDIPF